MKAEPGAVDRALQMPPLRQNAQGQLRRVGVELEMNGLSLDELAQQVASHLGLGIETKGRYERSLNGDPAGEWAVEMDFDLLKKLGRETRDKDTLAGELGDSAEEILKRLAETVVPMEVVSPPLPLSRLGEVEALVETLRNAGAKGTSDSWLNAFGMQFNPEVPALKTDVITAYLKAFSCLYDWLLERAKVNFSRRVTTYVDPYPTSYVRKLVANDYWPGQDQLIDDYLEANPTRNRALDMLPLFAYLDEDRVRGVVDNKLVKKRPTFHYRLPNCEIDLPAWGIYLAWNDWIQVERLAADTQRLRECCEAYHLFLQDPVDRWFRAWHEEVEARWLDR